jgi:hypothetical protein
MGKSGMIRTSNGFGGEFRTWSTDPIIEFKDCELTEKLADNRDNPLAISAVALTEAYAKNQEVSDQLYQDKWVLEGIVERVVEGQQRGPRVVDGRQGVHSVYLRGKEGMFVLCGPPVSTGGVTVAVGELVRFKGMCDGMQSANHSVIQLYSCELVAPDKPNKLVFYGSANAGAYRIGDVGTFPRSNPATARYRLSELTREMIGHTCLCGQVRKDGSIVCTVREVSWVNGVGLSMRYSEAFVVRGIDTKDLKAKSIWEPGETEYKVTGTEKKKDGSVMLVFEPAQLKN